MNLKEIAKAAGVSPSAVSLVLNGKSGVGVQKRAQVTQLLLSNGYSIAPRQSSERAKSICFLKFSRHGHLVNGNADFTARIMDAAEKECRRLGYEFRVVVFRNDQFPEILEKLRTSMPDGILLLGTELTSDDMAYLPQFSAPLVVVDNLLAREDYNCVDMNNEDASYKIAEHLYQKGHQEIGYLYNNLPSYNCTARFQAFREALPKFGLSIPEENIIPISPVFIDAYVDTLTLLKEHRRLPEALVATNDTIALAASKAILEFGLRIPEDISIIGFDNIQFSEFSIPALTTISVSCMDIGIWSVRLLQDRILYPHSPVVKIQVSTELISRERVKERRLPAAVK